MAFLPDLPDIVQECRDRLSLQNPSSEIRIDDKLWQKIKDAYLATVSSDRVEIVGGHTFKITTPENKNLAISCQELPQCWAAIPYYNALKKYEVVVDKLAKAIGFSSRTSGEARTVFKLLPAETWKADIGPDYVEKIRTALAEILGNDSDDIDRFYHFLEDPDWSGVAKKLNRTDWIVSAVQATGQWLAVGAARRGDLVAALAQDSEIEPMMKTVVVDATPPAKTDSVSPERLKGGENIIYYGAPGTGKSFTVDERSRHDEVFRTVFHPDVQNSDFVGTLKPVRDNDEITYRFSPGPFSLALVEAINNPRKKVWLIIEELNRAPAAAVFGDLFLLLDRDDNGRGEYDVNFPTEEFAAWYEIKTEDSSGKIRIPSNLWIAATMNSADQGVFPIDTAFRRRWNQIYIPVNYDSGPDGTVKCVTTGDTEAGVEWRIFIKTLNEHLSRELQTAEDRLVGPWFIKDAELGDDGILPGKVLIYLWDDLLRHHGRESVFRPDILTYGDLTKRVENGKPVFSDSLLENLAALTSATADAG